MFPPGPPGNMPPNMSPGVQTGPSPSFLQRMQGMTAPNVGPQNKKKKPQQPINGPRGMTPATSIMQTGNAGTNPYSQGESKTTDGNMVRGPSTMPFPMSPAPPTGIVPGGMGMGMGAPNMGMGMGQPPPFWNRYNQNRPPMMG